ncbi:MAG: F0F1 ATP synthase subunit epsilon [Mailhella sp.]|nr:F0F1 ATP synthase subunit epsilon [Mailhella sp.]MBQ4615479.1 F0F1 ATP synthase subunit epsilon [Mailhella sp.]
MEGLRLDIVTPDKVVLNAEVDYVGACGVDGQFGLMPQHAPLLSALTVGDLYYRQGNETHWVFIAGGFAQISDNKVTVLAECAELASDIDIERAKEAKARAEQRLADPKPDVDLVRAELALQRAVARIRVASR